MEYKDIKTADELESWYAEKQTVLDRHARDYMVPFGFVYHLDCSGYVSFERWNDTLPTAEEQTAFQAIQNGVSTKEIIEHKDEFGWIDRACRDAEEYDLAPCFIVPARKEYMQEQEIMNVCELYIVDANGRLLFDERFKPKHKKEWPEAQAVNHISPEDVEHLTTIDAYMEQICRILDHIADEIVGYNVAFDLGFLKTAGAAINPDAVIIDTMQEFMNAFGNSNTGHRYQPLSMAAERLGYNWTSAPHGSLPDTLACLAAQKCVDDHNWCVENLELTEDAIMNARPIESGSEGLPKDCWDLNPQGRPFAVTEPILHRLQSSAKLCARAGTTTQFTRMTVNQWFDKAERSRRSPLGRSVDIGRAASALNSQHEHAEVPQHLSK